MPEITSPPKPSRSPLGVIIESLKWAVDGQLALVPIVDGHGVRCDTTRGRKRWVLDGIRGTVDPIGAVLLHRQPPPLPDPDAAAAIALQAKPELLEGFILGCEGQEQPADWNGRERADFLRKGHEGGALVRMNILSRRTPASEPKLEITLAPPEGKEITKISIDLEIEGDPADAREVLERLLNNRILQAEIEAHEMEGIGQLAVLSALVRKEQV